MSTLSSTQPTTRTTGPGAVLSRLRGRNNEGILAATVLALIVVMGLVNPAFWSIPTLFGIARGSMVEIIFALGVLMVIITGQIDVSFPIVGIFAGYSTIVILQNAGADLGVLPAFLIAIAVGMGLGLINGVLIARFQLPALIVTLGTLGIFRGVLLAYVGSKYIGTLPDSIVDLSRSDLISAQVNGATTRLHIFVIPVIVLCVLVSWFLNRTMYGRGLYAMGGDIESARRVGFSVTRIQTVLYVAVGFLAGIAGMMHVTLSRTANPYELAGTELDIIAAVVLGGASILGGRGSVIGTVLGVVLISLIKNSLLLMGVPSTWHRVAVGILLILGVTAQLIGAKRQARRTELELDARDEEIEAAEVAK